MAINIIIAIANCFYVYGLLIVVRCLLTWIPNLNWNNPILRLIKEGADIYLDLFRKFIPPVGPFDLSPMVAMLVLFFLRNAIIRLAIFIFEMTGAIK